MTQEQPSGKTRFSALILEDDPIAADMLSRVVEVEGGAAVTCATVEEARKEASKQSFDLFLLDHRLPDGKGGDFFNFLRNQGITVPCIMLTGVPEIATAVELTRNGLFDYLTKPLEMPALVECLRRAILQGPLAQPALDSFGIVDLSPGMKRVRSLLHHAAANPATTVLLTGETGVGKDLIARALHQLTFRQRESSPPMISLNCSTLPADMFEAELFGAQKGAYTGAQQNRVGLVEAAQGGTLFLDEIAEVPLVLQAKLLQFLETREFRRLGSTNSVRFEGRIITATNRDLESEVSAQRFRADLWYRLDVFNICIPPLRERKEDLITLVETLLASLSKKYQRTKPMLKREDLMAIQEHPFPGNVRELRNLLERSLVVTAADASWLELDAAWLRKNRSPQTVSGAEKPEPIPTRGLGPLEEQEYLLIKKILDEEKGGIRRAAAKLGMSHQALLRRLEKWPELRVQQEDGV